MDKYEIGLDPNYDDQEPEKYTQEEIRELKELFKTGNERIAERSHLLAQLKQCRVLDEKNLIPKNWFYKADRFIERCLLFCNLDYKEHWLMNYIKLETFGKVWQSYTILNTRQLEKQFGISQKQISRAAISLEKKNIIDVMYIQKEGHQRPGNKVKYVRINTGVDTWDAGPDFKPMVKQYVDQVINNEKSKRTKKQG